jgi:hypothetical protein
LREARRRPRTSNDGRIATPAPRGGISTSAGTDRVEREVADQFERVRIALDQDGLVSALEAMACLAMPPVEMLRIAGVQPLHPSRQIGIRSSHDKVVVRRHEDKRVARPVVSKDDFVEELQKAASIDVIAIDGLPSHAPSGDVIHGARYLETSRTGHSTTIGRASGRVSSGARFVTKSLRS